MTKPSITQSHDIDTHHNNNGNNNTYHKDEVDDVIHPNKDWLLPPLETLLPEDAISSIASLDELQAALHVVSSHSFDILQDISTQIGADVSVDSYSGHYEEVLREYHRVLSSKVQIECNVLQQFQHDVHQLKGEVQSLAKALNVNIDMNHNDKFRDWSSEMSYYETQAESLRGVAHRMQQHLIVSRDKIQHYHHLLYHTNATTSNTTTTTTSNEWWCDVESDLTNAARSRLESYEKEMQDMVSSRTNVVQSLLQDVYHIAQELSVLSEYSVDDHNDENLIDDEDMEKQYREDMYLLNDAQYTLLQSVQQECDSQSDAFSETWMKDRGIHDETLQSLTNLHQHLTHWKHHRKTQLSELGTHIAALWTRLHVSEVQQQSFTNQVQRLGLSRGTVRLGIQEYQRLMRLRKEKLKVLYEEALDTCYTLLQQCGIANVRRQLQTQLQTPHLLTNSTSHDAITMSMTMTSISEESLNLLDGDISLLQSYLTEMTPILTLIQKREEVLQERWELEELTRTQPDRLVQLSKQRGAAMTKQLMLEEKMQRRIRKDLPRYTDVLRKKLMASSSHKDFVYTQHPCWFLKGGTRVVAEDCTYLQVMTIQEEEWRSYKDDQELQARLRRQHNTNHNINNSSNANRSSSQIRSRSALSNAANRSSHPPNHHQMATNNPTKTSLRPDTASNRSSSRSRAQSRPRSRIRGTNASA